ncbi:MAG: ABC transporter substrate-binding protein [Longicatena sp.]
MKKVLGGLVFCLALAGCGSDKSSEPVDKDKTFTIGIVQHNTHPALDDAVKGFKEALEKKDIKVKFVEKNAQGDKGTNDLIAKQFVSDGVDLIYAVATPSATAALNATNGKDTPIIFNAVTDAEDAKLVKSNDKPGGNITGVSDAAPLEQQLKLIREVLPNAKTIGMMYNIGEPNGKLQVEQVEKLASKYNFTIQVKGISQGSEIASAAQQLAESSDCIYNITDNMIASNSAAIADKATAQKIPVFAAEEGQMVGSGIMASDSISYKKLGEQAAEMTYNILVKGEKTESMAVQTAQSTSLIINKKVMESLGITIPEDLAKRATYMEE